MMMMMLASWIYELRIIPSSSKHHQKLKNSTMEARVSLKGLEVEEDFLNLEFRGLNI